MRSEEEILKAMETLHNRPDPLPGQEMKYSLIRMEELAKILALEWVLGKRDSM